MDEPQQSQQESKDQKTQMQCDVKSASVTNTYNHLKFKINLKELDLVKLSEGSTSPLVKNKQKPIRDYFKVSERILDVLI